MNKLSFKEYLQKTKEVASSDLERSEKIQHVTEYKKMMLKNTDLQIGRAHV